MKGHINENKYNKKLIMIYLYDLLILFTFYNFLQLKNIVIVLIIYYYIKQNIQKMISIEKIVQNLQQCKDVSITLPKPNIKYIQKTAVEIRKEELELLNTNFKHLNEANYTMDSEYDKLKKEKENIKHTIDQLPQSTSNSHNHNNSKVVNTQDIIPIKSLIIYNENEIAQLPETLLQLFNYFDPCININLLYLYGVKNPESFYKSFLFLYKVDFIIKNNTEKKNEVATFKREMAIHYETFYKTLNYRKYKFSRTNMVSNLTNVDNYTDYDSYQYIADYTKNNFIMLDIITSKYIDIKYNDNEIIEKNKDKTDHISNKDLYFIIIKYSANTFLPLMSSSGNHYFPSKVLEYISKTYERLIFTAFVKRQEQEQDLENTAFQKQDLENPARKYSAKNKSNSENDSIDVDGDDIDNMLNESSTFNIEEAFNNSIRLQNENSIINKNNPISYIFEDMIQELNHVEEVEDKPMSNVSTTKVEVVEEVEEVKVIEPIPEPMDDLQKLMCKIPMSKGSKIKIKKVDTKVDTKVEIKIDKSVIDTNQASSGEEELLPIGKYNLLDLQRLALLHKIDTQKMGTMGKKINKLKAELYSEITEKSKNKFFN